MQTKTVRRPDNSIVGWVSRDQCNNNKDCKRGVAQGRPFHATPGDCAATLPDYHFATLEDAERALLAIDPKAGHEPVQSPNVKRQLLNAERWIAAGLEEEVVEEMETRENLATLWKVLDSARIAMATMTKEHREGAMMVTAALLNDLYFRAPEQVITKEDSTSEL